MIHFAQNYARNGFYFIICSFLSLFIAKLMNLYLKIIRFLEYFRLQDKFNALRFTLLVN